MTSTRTTTITLRVSHELLARIDNQAKRAGQDRNSYVLSWLPEYYSDRSVRWHPESEYGRREASRSGNAATACPRKTR